jgi:hypothetical protein
MTKPRPKSRSAKASPAPAARRARAYQRTSRAHEWTRAKMREFLRALAATASVSQAAQQVGMSRQSAYDLRARLVGRPFDLAGEVALEHALQQLGHAALERAIHGVPRPHYYQGEKVGEHRVFNESLTLFLLNNPGRVGRFHIARDYYSREWEGLLDRVEHGELEWLGDDEPKDTPAARKKRDEIVRDFVTEQTHYFRDGDSKGTGK